MKEAELIDVKDLKEAVLLLNKTELLDEPIVVKGKSVANIADNFVIAIDSLDEEVQVNLPDKVIEMYNFLIEDEVEEGGEEVVVEEKKECEGGEKKARKKKSSGAKGEKKKYLERLIRKGKYTINEIVEKYVARFGGEPITVRTLLYHGMNPKYNKFSSLVVKNGKGILSFVK